MGQARLHSNLNAFSKGTPQPTSPRGRRYNFRPTPHSELDSERHENSSNDFKDNSMRAKWANRFPRWPPHRIDGRIYELSHLHPFRYPLLLPEKLNRESREVEIRVAFSAHTFTRGCSIAEDPDYHYSTAPRDLRKFCPNRYELSKILPDVVRSLDVRKCFFTDRNNYFVVELPEPLPAGFEYRVFFDVRGVAEPNAVLLFIQSAYAGDTRKSPYSRRREKVRFRMLVSKALEGRRSKRPP